MFIAHVLAILLALLIFLPISGSLSNTSGRRLRQGGLPTETVNALTLSGEK